MSKISTLKRALQNHEAFDLVLGHINEYTRCAIIKNNNIWYLQKQNIVFNKLKKKYAKVIATEIKSDKRKKSNIIWILWLQGEKKAPPLVKACINSIRRNTKDREIIVLNEENLQNYIQLPEYVWEKWKKGIIPNAHFSDLIRVELLCKYGGLWVDSTVLFTGQTLEFEYIVNAPLFVYKEMDLIKRDWMPTIASNWLIGAYSNSKILLLTRKLLLLYWKTHNTLVDYYIFHFFFSMSAQRYKEEWDEIEMFNNRTPHTMQAELKCPFDEKRWNKLVSMSCFHKLNRYVDYENEENSLYKYIIDRYYINAKEIDNDDE